MRHLDIELQDLKSRLLHMSDDVQRAIDEAVAGVLERQPSKFDTVTRLEEQINQAHMDIDAACLKLLATQAPLANNLRYVIAVIKINTDLERMGDQAVNISLNGRFYLNEPEEQVRDDIATMANEARIMVRESLEAFFEHDITLANAVLVREEKVDDLKDKVLRDLVPFMESDSKTVQRSLDLILIARNLERIGDHATNIAEDVIFACTGDDVRHSSRNKPRIRTEDLQAHP